MRLARPMATVLLATAIVAIVLGLGLVLCMGRAAEDRLYPGEAVVIGELRGALPANAFLACPPGYCAVAGAAASPIFELPWERLGDYWVEMIAGESGVVPLGAGAAEHRLVFIQHSPLLRFPDIITVEFVSLGPNRSSFAIYSRARYGRADFGVNRKRVHRWLKKMQQIAGPPVSPTPA